VPGREHGPLNRLRSIAVGCAAASIAMAAPATAATRTIDFDDLAPGTTLTSMPGVTFTGNPTVFNPANVSTFTEPHAVHTAGTCFGTSNCPSGANRLEVKFDPPVGSVSWRVGLDDEGSGEFGAPSELLGYDKFGTVVATSGEIDLGHSGFHPITREFTANSDNIDIVRAELTVGKHGTGRRANADHLVFTDAVEPPPPPPSVAFTSPAEGAAFDRIDDIRISGRVTAPAPVLRFCVTVGSAPPGSFPATCEQRAQLAADGTFTNLRAGTFVTGTNYITAWVEDVRFRRASRTIAVTVREHDVRVTNMEVTQGIQSRLPVPEPDALDVEHAAEYNGLRLIRRKATAVRVWTAARLDPAGTPIRGVALHLFGFRPDGTPLPRGPLVPLEGSRDLGPPLSFDAPIGLPTWSDAASSWTFMLPGDWVDTAGPITLRAVVNPATAYPRVNECPSCGTNNTLSLRDIRFQAPNTIHIWPYQVIYRRDGARVAPPGDVFGADMYGLLTTFREMHAVSPFNVAVHPYRGTLSAQRSADSGADGADSSDNIMDTLTDAIDIAGYPGFHTIAMVKGLANGLNADHFSWSSFTVRNYSVVNTDRPLTSMAHEIYHAIGFEHAGRSCEGAIEGGGAVSWPPDDRGLLQGLGTDVRPVYSRRPLRLFALQDAAGNPLESFDFMSYCADSEPVAWISARNWEAAGGRSLSKQVGAGGGLVAAQPAAGPTLAVHATAFPDGGRISAVTPAGSQLTPPAGDGSLRIIVRDVAGAVLTDLPVAGQAAHVDPGGGTSGEPIQQLTAVVPATNAASVELVRNGQILDTRRRTPASPSVSVTTPKGGLRVRSSQRVLGVRWKLSDADGGPLTSKIEYSADGGKTYRGVAAGLTSATFDLPARFLTRSSKARVRLTVSDGWNETAAVSKRFRVDGPPPAVAILSPPKNTSLAADQVLNLEGTAFDDRSRILTGDSLRWFDGNRAIGRGERVSLLGLRPGTHGLRLVARDSTGRTAQARLRIRILAVTPRFLALSVPAKLSSKARFVKVRVASSVVGTLEVGRRRFGVDRRTRTYRIPVKPGSKELVLRPKLRSGKRSASAVVTIPRGQ
jgi:hypothetical protein